ncbi:hypothetical protein [Ruegeria sp. EL01]|jgi:hypothetical protein|uniref:hypothetical protein n=1 Tax=Ruegeria sp. EL01 TaxID=2107578 RepID=UPI000EA8064E|nr:hypothetical protein [Ruegeria sp. EL01]
MRARRFSTVRRRLFDLLKTESGHEPVVGDKVSVHLAVSGISLPVFLDKINNSAGFSQDGIFLTPGEVVNDPTVFELLVALWQEYIDRGLDVA